MAVSPHLAMRMAKKDIFSDLGNRRTAGRMIHDRLLALLVQPWELALLALAAGTMFVTKDIEGNASRLFWRIMLIGTPLVIALVCGWRHTRYTLLDEDAPGGSWHPPFQVKKLWDYAADHSAGDFNPFSSFMCHSIDPIQALYLRPAFEAFCRLEAVTLEDAKKALMAHLIPLTAALNYLLQTEEVHTGRIPYQPPIFWLDNRSPDYLRHREFLNNRAFIWYAWANPFFEQERATKQAQLEHDTDRPMSTSH